MRICVVVPNAEYLRQAGARIRYKRLKSLADPESANIDFVTIDLASKHLTKKHYDVIVISKCYDARAIVLARLAPADCRVGCDLFDDYFSQRSFAPLGRLRYWFRELVQELDFLLCSTERTKKIAFSYAPNLPCHVMNDPAGDVDFDHLEVLLNQKKERRAGTVELKVAWYGMGDNPYFSVGLSDLVDFSEALLPLRDVGYEPSISILTNTRALSNEALQHLQLLPFRYKLEQWTEHGENRLLGSCDVVFIPVNVQAFSIAKSLNRAVTALVNGCQVLSVGHALYAQLSDFVYRDTSQLASDLTDGCEKLSSDKLDVFRQHLDRYASTKTELQHLTNFLGSCDVRRQTEQNTIAVIHGSVSHRDISKFCAKTGCLSVASPFVPLKQRYDIIMQISNQSLVAYVDPKVVKQRGISVEASSRSILGKQEMMVLASVGLPTCYEDIDPLDGSELTLKLCYPTLINSTLSLIQQVFTDALVIVSEQAKSPLNLDQIIDA